MKYVTIVTGFNERTKDMSEFIESELKDLTVLRFGNNGEHPRNISSETEAVVTSFFVKQPDSHLVVRTNSDHAINMLRLMRNRGGVDKLDVYHFGETGRDYVECESIGEFTGYPDGFLDEWPKLLCEILASPHGETTCKDAV